MIENEKDGSLVREVADLVHVKPELKKIERGQYVILAGDKHELIGEQFLAEPKTLALATLTGVVDAYQYFAEQVEEPIVIHIAGPDDVRVVSPNVGKENQTFLYARAVFCSSVGNWNHFQAMDEFIMALQVSCQLTPERDRLLKHVGALTAGLAAEIMDDGTSQQVTARRGLMSADKKTAFTNPVQLAPFRTFPEVEQPHSPFVLRLRQTGEGQNLTAQAALIEAGGGAWAAEAICNIGAWLRERLPDATILA